ncbi:heme oxygenase [Salinihabitans flavidus]|uniref:Heme oxygenase n=1 Tax=Salinihabitans flavidus TaxID=569882 RepID=A0A1H8RL62_9RHOB|nr:biliverdin-producing heme oxygenase [Salinihabitans flavidus]SEO66997.1 heme oxygenase [Salinihabitans flavidus]
MESVETASSLLSLPLSGDLRARTASLHDQAEALLGLPESIADRDEYADWLAHFLAFYHPLERAFGAFSKWDILKPFSAKSTHSQRLIRDLGALGFDVRALSHAPNARIPALPTFAYALGARYVLEGSALGGKVILRNLQQRIGAEIAGATDFFGGAEPAPSSDWRVFKKALDRFGDQRPESCDDVLMGAEETFRALLGWFEPFVVKKKNMVQSPYCGNSLKLATADPPKFLEPVGARK